MCNCESLASPCLVKVVMVALLMHNYPHREENTYQYIFAICKPPQVTIKKLDQNSMLALFCLFSVILL